MFRRKVRGVTCFTETRSGINLGILIASKCPDVKVNIVIKTKGKYLKVSRLTKNQRYDSYKMNEMLLAQKDKNLFFPTDDVACIEESDMIFLFPDCKLKSHGVGSGKVLDFSMVEDIARKIIAHSYSSKVVVNSSFVSLRTSDFINSILLSHSGPERFEVLYNPDIFHFSYIYRMLNQPERLPSQMVHGAMIGYRESSPDAMDAVGSLSSIYQRWVFPECICTSDIEVLELAQMVTYTLVAQRIANVRITSLICNAFECDFEEVSAELKLFEDVEEIQPLSSYGEEYFSKIVSVLSFLCETNGLPEVADFWRQINAVDKEYKKLLLDRLSKTLRPKDIRKSATLLGFPTTPDSFAVEVAIALLDNGISLSIYEVDVEEDEVFEMLIQGGYSSAKPTKGSILLYESVYKACSTSNVLVFTGGWFQFSSVDFEKVYGLMKKPAYIFDLGISLPVSKFVDLGFHVYSNGIMKAPKNEPPAETYQGHVARRDASPLPQPPRREASLGPEGVLARRPRSASASSHKPKLNPSA